MSNYGLSPLLSQYFTYDAIRYSNMDFALVSSLTPSLDAGISRVLVSYDIACQWHKNLQSRLDNYPAFPSLQLSDLRYWKVAVPKFHLPAHGTDCQLLYNLSYIKWAGRMDGERIESGWAQTNPMATWTRESGPNARRGILDDHWNAGNWQKLLGLRECMVFLFLSPILTPNIRCISRPEPSAITRVEEDPAGGRESHIWELHG